eukprot:1274058-Pyramimonas_sp.AAC.1
METGGLQKALKRLDDMDVSSCWTDRHEKEMQFAKQKLAKREVQAVSEGVLHGTAETRKLAEESVAKLADGVIKRDKTAIRNLEVCLGGDLPTKAALRYSAAWTDSDASAASFPSWSLTRTLHPWRASVFVVADPGARPVRAPYVWAAFLRGGHVINHAVLTGNGIPICIKYHAALAQRRKLFISDGFKAHHEHIANIFRLALVDFSGC